MGFQFAIPRAAKAASLIKHGYNIFLSGFTPAVTAGKPLRRISKNSGSCKDGKRKPFHS